MAQKPKYEEALQSIKARLAVIVACADLDTPEAYDTVKDQALRAIAEIAKAQGAEPEPAKE